MAVSLDEYRTELINNILFADSQEAVKGFIDSAMRTLEQNKVNAYIIARFADRMASELELFNPMKKEAEQWSNITMAKILFNRIRSKYKAISN